MIYHVISKLRGNEKNWSTNNFGIYLAALGLVYYSVEFTDLATYTFALVEYGNWFENHVTPFWYIMWSGDSAYLMYHWFFN